MEWMSLNTLREKYLSFFESKGHLRLPSFPLVPKNDNSLLLINSGMAPMKKYFTGEVTPPSSRVTTCQKCIRTPDLERVGHTARHGTFFEMLGNFSFGDYFKEEAISWAWEFLTEVLEIPAELLWPSIYEEDEEAFEIWTKKMGVPEERIVRLGKADNFWEHGTGPCGPCSEIYFDRGEKYGCGSPDCKPGCECDRFMEIWNNVFSQFNNMGDGTYTELKHKNIDTGMGLERLACVMQGVDNMFEVDTIRKVIDKTSEISGKKYGDNSNDDISIRVVTDHSRSAMFMIADGVIPSNEGRGYVLRRIIRRACRHGKLLGINRSFLTETVTVSIEESKGAYPELDEKRDYILKVISMEEDRFDATVDAGLSILSDLIRAAVADKSGVISGEEVFKLYDTFGFPIDLTREIAAESDLSIDENKFLELMEQQKIRAREARTNIGGWDESSVSALRDLPKTEFTGYTDFKTKAKVIAIITDEGSVDTLSEGDCTIILDKTPFYGESGGQVGDTGTIYSDKFLFNVYDTKKSEGIFLHIGTVAAGEIKVGDTVSADINDGKRVAVMRNHSAAHLLQAALRSVLGTHVEQSGSYVSDEVCRFDFTHFAALTDDEIKKVEKLVNMNILAANDIVTVETDIETARKNGAMALFDDKYGDRVRMVRMGNFSTELCGGTHCDNTGKIGLFKIISESSVAAGIRRIEAVTGIGVLMLLSQKEKLISDTAAVLRVQNINDIEKRAGQVMAELKEAQKTVDTLNQKLASSKISDVMKDAKLIKGVRVVSMLLNGTAPDELRKMTDTVKADNADAVAVFGSVNGEKLTFCAACGSEAIKMGAHAGNIVREVAKIAGGNGGGKPDSAMAGGKEINKAAAAIDAVYSIVEGFIK